jgi:Xaa-Pro aminopeptidase
MNLEKLQRERREKVLEVAEEEGLEAIIAANYDSFRYITDIQPLYSADFSIDAYGVVISKTGKAVVMSYYQERQPSWIEKVISAPTFVPATVATSLWVKIFGEALRLLGVTRGRIGIDYVTFDVVRELAKKNPKLQFMPVSNAILRARSVKTVEEIELVREAARVVDLGATVGLSAIHEGMTENMLAAEIVRVMAAEGIEGIPWHPTVRSGERTLKGMFPSDRKFREGDAVVFDIGCVAKGGYIGDMSRTGFVGKPNPKLKRLHEALYSAYMRAIESVRPGIFASDIDKTCREALIEEGYPTYDRPTGHGLGLRALELPWIARSEEVGDKDMRIEKNMILSIEPSTFEKGLAGVKLEDMVLVTDSGFEILTKTKIFPET